VRHRSRRLWLAYEAEVAKHTGTASPQTLTADDPQRATVKGHLKAKHRPTMASYGWIQYSTQGALQAAHGGLSAGAPTPHVANQRAAGRVLCLNSNPTRSTR
jgi:hypothetical protein